MTVQIMWNVNKKIRILEKPAKHNQMKSVSVQNYWFKNIKNKLKQSSVNLVYRAPPLASEGVSTSETKFKAINSSSWSSGTSLKASIETAVPCPSLFRPKVWYLGIKDRPSFRSRSEEVAILHFLKSGKWKKKYRYSTDILQREDISIYMLNYNYSRL